MLPVLVALTPLNGKNSGVLPKKQPGTQLVNGTSSLKKRDGTSRLNVSFHWNCTQRSWIAGGRGHSETSSHPYDWKIKYLNEAGMMEGNYSNTLLLGSTALDLLCEETFFLYDPLRDEDLFGNGPGWVLYFLYKYPGKFLEQFWTAPELVNSKQTRLTSIRFSIPLISWEIVLVTMFSISSETCPTYPSLIPGVIVSLDMFLIANNFMFFNVAFKKNIPTALKTKLVRSASYQSNWTRWKICSG